MQPVSKRFALVANLPLPSELFFPISPPLFPLVRRRNLHESTLKGFHEEVCYIIIYIYMYISYLHLFYVIDDAGRM